MTEHTPLIPLADREQITRRAWNLVRSYVHDLRLQGFEDYESLNPDELKKYDDEDLHAALSDAITDLFHLALDAGMDVETIQFRIDNNLREERQEEIE